MTVRPDEHRSRRCDRGPPGNSPLARHGIAANGVYPVGPFGNVCPQVYRPRTEGTRVRIGAGGGVASQVEQYESGTAEQLVNAAQPGTSHDVGIGHPISDQWVSTRQVIAGSKT